MPAIKKIGPCTAIVEPGRLGEGDKLGVSATYRNIAAADELPTTVRLLPLNLLYSSLQSILIRHYSTPQNLSFHISDSSMQLNGASTMYEVFEASATKFADRPCLGWRPVNDDGTPGDFKFHSYQETRTMARNLASSLAHSGITKGGKVGILSANNVQWMLGIRASDMLAASVVPMYDTLGESAVEYIINHSGLTVALIEPAKLPAFAAIAPAVASQVTTIVTTSEPQDDAAKAAAQKIVDAGIKVHGFEEYLKAGAAKPVEPTPPSAEDIACIMYTR
jgi:long-chain acyl-CoA synthetase